MNFNACLPLLLIISVGLSAYEEPLRAGSLRPRLRDEGGLELMQEFAKGQIGVKLQINCDGQVLMRPRWKKDNLLYYLVAGLKEETPVPMEFDFIGLFEFKSRIFGVLADMRLIEFELLRPRMVNGNLGLPLKVSAASAGCMALSAACAWMGWDAMASIYGVSSLAPLGLAFSVQRRCQLKVKLWGLGSACTPVYVSQMDTEGQESYSDGLPHVREVQVRCGMRGPERPLSEYLNAEDACAKLLAVPQVGYLPE